MKREPDLSILIVTSLNSRALVLACLRSIHADSSAPSLEVIVVDNASEDGTVEAILAEFPTVRVLRNSQNVGFPRANNQGLAVARGRHILYLNPDTELFAGTLAACVRELDTHDDVGVVGCRLEFPDGRIQYVCARNTYRFRHLVYELFYLHMLFPHSRIFGSHLMGDWDHRGTRDVEAVSGAFMMVPRSVALGVGGLPEDVFIYHEDLSFCLRIRRSGRRLRYLGSVGALHHGGGSTRKSTARLHLLDAECKHRFIREADGEAWGAAARCLLGVRAAMRIGIGVVGLLLPRRWKTAYPRVFDIGGYWLQLRWAVNPPSARRQLPRPPDVVPEPVRAGAWT